jgi:hypothetical protein
MVSPGARPAPSMSNFYGERRLRGRGRCCGGCYNLDSIAILGIDRLDRVWLVFARYTTVCHWVTISSLMFLSIARYLFLY